MIIVINPDHNKNKTIKKMKLTNHYFRYPLHTHRHVSKSLRANLLHHLERKHSKINNLPSQLFPMSAYLCENKHLAHMYNPMLNPWTSTKVWAPILTHNKKIMSNSVWMIFFNEYSEFVFCLPQSAMVRSEAQHMGFLGTNKMVFHSVISTRFQ